MGDAIRRLVADRRASCPLKFSLRPAKAPAPWDWSFAVPFLVSLVAFAAALILGASACASAVQPSGAAAEGAGGTAAADPRSSTAEGPPTISPAPEQAAPTPAIAATEVPEGVAIGKRAPDFALPALGGGQISLSQFRGKAVLVNFWASWCVPCRDEMPALDELYRRRQDQGLVVVGVNFGEDPDTAGAFVRKGGYSFPVALDRDTEVAFKYQAVALPTSYLIDRDGIVQDRVIGAMTAEVMQAKAERILGPAGQAPVRVGSVVEAAGAANEQVVAALGDRQITAREVNHRVDVLLALDRLDDGAVLDPSRPADQAELRQRQKYALEDLINGALLAEAARGAGLKADPTPVDHELSQLAGDLGSSDALAAELAKHGVTIADVRALLEEQSLAGAYVEQEIVPSSEATSAQDAVSRWLDAERARHGVRVPRDLGAPSS